MVLLIRNRTYLYIIVAFLIIGIIHALVSYSFLIFLTWFLISLWGIFTLKFIEKLKYARELNSPQNTIFFVFLPFVIGFLFLFWGHYTPFLNQNIFQKSDFYLSPWNLIFAFPYLIYSLINLFLCFRKYDFVYIGSNSYNGNKVAIFIAILWILFGLLLSVLDEVVYEVTRNVFSFYVTNYYFDSILVILTVFAGIMLVYGIIKRRNPLPEINQDMITRRRNRISNIQNAQPRSIETTRRRSQSSSSRSSTPTRTTRRSSSSRSTRTTRRTSSRSRSKKKKKSKRKPKPKARKKIKTTKKSVKLGELKPKSGNLSIDDFKCIHCFRLPELPKDRGRGIVVCPHCKYPSHADEFKDWLKNSTLCSRCDSPLPGSYIRNPPVIPVNVYLRAIKKLLSKK